MVDFILIALSMLGFMHIGVPLIYILWMRRVASTHPWSVKINPSYAPQVTVILPTYNEEEVILGRLQNLLTVNYPRERMEVILVDSASKDKTVSLAKEFASQHPEFRMRIMEEERRGGKARAMNLALQAARGDVIVTTDADTYWALDALKVLLSYLGDPSVGAVTGMEVPLNPNQSSATRSEVAYHVAYEPIRVGESRIHSTLVFNGELAAFKRQCLKKFDEVSGGDDMGAAISVAERGFRCLQIPEAKTYNYIYYTWRGKVAVKLRRAQQMVCLWLRCLRLMLNGRLKLPCSIMIPELYLHLLNPIVGALFYTSALLAAFRYPVLVLPALILASLPTTRRCGISFITHNAFLLMGMWKYLKGERQVVWRKVQETRVATSGLVQNNLEVRVFA